MPIVEGVGRIHVKLSEALDRLARQKLEPEVVQRPTVQIKLVKKRADGTVIEEITRGFD